MIEEYKVIKEKVLDLFKEKHPELKEHTDILAICLDFAHKTIEEKKPVVGALEEIKNENVIKCKTNYGKKRRS
jgi:hypothetical protein